MAPQLIDLQKKRNNFLRFNLKPLLENMQRLYHVNCILHMNIYIIILSLALSAYKYDILYLRPCHILIHRQLESNRSYGRNLSFYLSQFFNQMLDMARYCTLKLYMASIRMLSLNSD